MFGSRIPGETWFSKVSVFTKLRTAKVRSTFSLAVAGTSTAITTSTFGSKGIRRKKVAIYLWAHVRRITIVLSGHHLHLTHVWRCRVCIHYGWAAGCKAWGPWIRALLPPLIWHIRHASSVRGIWAKVLRLRVSYLRIVLPCVPSASAGHWVATSSWTGWHSLRSHSLM